MRMPEMNVVRFTESDVIVASGKTLTSMYCMNFDNTSTGDAYVVVGSDTYRRTGSPNFSDLDAAYSNLTNSTKIYWDDGKGGYGQSDWSAFQQMDSNTSASGQHTDGTFVWRTGDYGLAFYKQ